MNMRQATVRGVAMMGNSALDGTVDRQMRLGQPVSPPPMQ